MTDRWGASGGWMMASGALIVLTVVLALALVGAWTVHHRARAGTAAAARFGTPRWLHTPLSDRVAIASAAAVALLVAGTIFGIIVSLVSPARAAIHDNGSVATMPVLMTGQTVDVNGRTP